MFESVDMLKLGAQYAFACAVFQKLKINQKIKKLIDSLSKNEQHTEN
jgi:hypothetical protein